MIHRYKQKSVQKETNNTRNQKNKEYKETESKGEENINGKHANSNRGKNYSGGWFLAAQILKEPLIAAVATSVNICLHLLC